MNHVVMKIFGKIKFVIDFSLFKYKIGGFYNEGLL